MKIVSFEGSGTETVRKIVLDAGHTFTLVKNRHQAYQVEMDRLILLGGRDISPFLYGQPIIHAGQPNEVRDAAEWVLVRRAMNEHIPMMGICRGCQMIAIAHGGTLYQDIYFDMGIDHPNVKHTIRKINKKLRSRIPEARVNSIHHQAIAQVPLGFEVAALSKDSIVEAIYRPGVLGVQWHPEYLYEKDARWVDLFHWWLEGLQ